MKVRTRVSLDVSKSMGKSSEGAGRVLGGMLSALTVRIVKSHHCSCSHVHIYEKALKMDHPGGGRRRNNNEAVCANCM